VQNNPIYNEVFSPLNMLEVTSLIQLI